MTPCNRVVWVIRELLSPDDMAPVRAKLSTRWNSDDGAVLVLDVDVAAKASRTDILDGVVAAWGTDTGEGTLAGAIDAQLLEDSMARGQGGQRAKAENGGLHGEL